MSALLFETNDEAELNPSRLLGQRGEEIAARHLEENDYRLVVSNFKVPVGRNTRGAEVTGEIDLIAIDKDTLCFVEVKTRTANDLFEPSEAVNLRKQRQIIRTAKVYRNIFRVSQIPHRYDVVGIVLSPNELPHIELLQDFFTEDKFRKKTWNPQYWNDYI
ncbi:MAG TPA: YraN family protein [Pyrinomonadaceae bacterium]|nr:YraN family protein [Pyrinomonadaceae bacterium]